MRIFLTIGIVVLPLTSCKKEQAAVTEQTPERHTTSGGEASFAPLFPTTLPRGSDSVNALKKSLGEVRAANTVVDSSGATETLHLDEASFQKIVSAFAAASKHKPDRALRLLESEPGELRAAVVSRHLSNLIGSGGGSPQKTNDREAFDYVESIDDDDERRGAAWLLVKELLATGELAESEVADAIKGLDGISHTTANRMVAATANRLSNERFSQ